MKTHTNSELPELNAEQEEAIKEMKRINAHIIKSMAAYHSKYPDAKLSSVIAVFSKMSASMAMHFGMDEEEYIEAQRDTYRVQALFSVLGEQSH